MMKLQLSRRRLMGWLSGFIPALGVGGASFAGAEPPRRWVPDDLAERHAAAREYVAAYKAAWPKLRAARLEFHQLNQNPHDFYTKEWPEAQKVLDQKLAEIEAAIKPTTDLCRRRRNDSIAVCVVSGAPIWGCGHEEYLEDWYSGEYVLRQAVGLPLNRPAATPGMEKFFSEMMRQPAR